jgi:hypothetical protein
VDLRVDIELREGLLLATVNGQVALDAGLRLLKQVCATAKEKQINKILVNTLAVDGELSTFDRYKFGVELVQYLKELHMEPKLAFVGKPPAMDGFGVRVGQNRGLVTEVFPSQEEAVNWLSKWPG